MEEGPFSWLGGLYRGGFIVAGAGYFCKSRKLIILQARKQSQGHGNNYRY